MPTDSISQLQYEYAQLLRQFFSSYSVQNQRHPLIPPEEIPGLKFTTGKLAAPNGPGPEDTKIVYPLEPQDGKVFEDAQHELIEDLVLKTKQIQQLIAGLPGIDKDEEQQAREIQDVAMQVEEMEKVKQAKRREMHQLVKRLDAVLGGMSRSIDYTRTYGAGNGG